MKPLLYVYRVLLTGIHLMRSGEIEANLLRLNEDFKLPHIPELIQQKVEGTEKGSLDDADMSFHEAEYARLVSDLEAAHQTCTLPDVPSGKAALNDLLVRVRV